MKTQDYPSDVTDEQWALIEPFIPVYTARRPPRPTCVTSSTPPSTCSGPAASGVTCRITSRPGAPSAGTSTSGGRTAAATYTYDALDRRIGFKENGTQTWVAFHGSGRFTNPYADFDGAGALLVRYAAGPGVNDLLARTTSGGATTWYLGDRLGSVRDLASSSGAVVDHVVYDSYGGVAGESSPGSGDRFK